MFLWIAVHNVQVSFLIFIAGILAGLGTVWLLFSNGVMLGAFQYYFFSKGLGWKSVLVIWIHGTLEISSIIIAGAAGIVLGKSLIFTGTFKRLPSVKRGARDGIKMMIGLVPVFIMAAFLEGFVTRYSQMPVWLSLFILIGSAVFIIWYFVVYPIRLSQKEKVKQPVKIPDSPMIKYISLFVFVFFYPLPAGYMHKLLRIRLPAPLSLIRWLRRQMIRQVIRMKVKPVRCSRYPTAIILF